MRQDDIQSLIKLLNTISVLCPAGVLIYGIYKYMDYRQHTEVYMTFSAAWYTGIVVFGIGAAIIVLICMLLKWIIKKNCR